MTEAERRFAEHLCEYTKRYGWAADYIPPRESDIAKHRRRFYLRFYWSIVGVAGTSALFIGKMFDLLFF